MSDPTIRARLECALWPSHLVVLGLAFGTTKASPSAEGALRARQREFLDLLGHVHPQSHAAMASLIWP